ncbi:coordinator of PRMT5 and differentiation stimulator isoform X3 [Balaenoptera musculus]|uniref:Coordinator of PRMT5 and differentiation stimulator isoform X3 n=1 Tax=Balaenoptera musculus TaxID=9771 RepID=A0A8B8W487_BALMU|nr:coordinator of PRMT5 and differentiation stimulator isoform X3 [Balaenoptera musculus]
MDSRTAGAPALGAVKPPPGLPLLSTREAPPGPGAAFAPAGRSGQERETEKAVDRLASGAQSFPHDSPAHGEGTHCEEEGFAVDDEDSDGEPSPWELSEGVSGCPRREQAADLFNEDWDLELKADQGNPYVGIERLQTEVLCSPVASSALLGTGV